MRELCYTVRLIIAHTTCRKCEHDWSKFCNVTFNKTQCLVLLALTTLRTVITVIIICWPVNSLLTFELTCSWQIYRHSRTAHNTQDTRSSPCSRLFIGKQQHAGLFKETCSLSWPFSALTKITYQFKRKLELDSRRFVAPEYTELLAKLLKSNTQDIWPMGLCLQTSEMERKRREMEDRNEKRKGWTGKDRKRTEENGKWAGLREGRLKEIPDAPMKDNVQYYSDFYFWKCCFESEKTLDGVTIMTKIEIRFT